MATKKSTKKQVKSTEPRPAKRKKIVSLEQYQAEANAPKGDEPVVVEDAPAAEAALTIDKKRSSGLDAAVTVLTEAGQPLTAGEMVERMLGHGLWQTSGKTPAATIYAAIHTEIKKKGQASRFRKAARGKFELNR